MYMCTSQIVLDRSPSKIVNYDQKYNKTGTEKYEMPGNIKVGNKKRQIIAITLFRLYVCIITYYIL